MRAFRAMGTEWSVEAAGCSDAALRAAERLVRAYERRLSRFDPGSALSALHRERASSDPVLATVVGCALEWRAATAGTFDPTVGDAVIAAGYDQSFEAVRARANWALRRGETRPAVPVHGDTVRLNGTGTLDLGGIGKGWTADRVGALLRAAGATSYCIDAGGDLLIESGATGETLVELCSGGYRVGVVRGAVASSSVLHRRWSTDQGPRHHIVDPVTGEAAAHGWVQCSVVAADAETADVLATALLAGGERALFALAARGAEALIVGADARCLMTPGLAGWLR